MIKIYSLCYKNLINTCYKSYRSYSYESSFGNDRPHVPCIYIIYYKRKYTFFVDCIKFNFLNILIILKLL